MAKERKASVMYEGNASQLVYAFPFDYLRKKFVKVEDIYTNITELTMGVDYTVEDKQVRLVKGIPLGHSVKIYRETTTDPLVEWQDASVLRSADLSLQEVQLLHLAEETSDKVFDSGMSTAYDNPNCWDGQYKRIINALDPIEDGDVVTLRYIKANQDSLLNQLKNTGAAQNASIIATGDTQNARLTATGDNQNKRLTTTGDTQNTRLVTTGNSYVSTMTTLKDTTTTKATEANNSADLAKKWAVSTYSPDGATDSKSSKTWAEAAKTAASNAAASASASQSSAESSASYVATASSSANAAKQSALSSANSASAASSSASNASTSASNAKMSETNAANSAKAAAQSAIDAAKFDPSSYYLKAEVDAKIPTKTSQLTNDSDFTTNNALALALDEAKAEVKEGIPTKTSQLTNDSGFANAASLAEEAKKWKDAYNALRKRSYPTAFDDDELTVLMDTPADRGDIILSQPYTDFDGLLIDYTYDSGSRYVRDYISSAEITHRKEECIKIGGSKFALFNGNFYWSILVNDEFSPTCFPEDTDNCMIQRIYGVKFKEIT